MDDVARVKDAIDAIAYISAYVPLKKTGGQYQGRCPFHDDKSPSFSVRADGVFHCFGCGAGGDILRFIELKEGVEFREALRRAAEFAGVALSEASTAGGPDRDTFAAGVALLENAATYFHRMLLQSTRAQAAREALEQRAFAPDLWERFQLGYAWGLEDDWTALVRKKGWSLDLAMRLGLINQSGNRDRFRHRLMFPIRDATGRAAGFGGRRLDEADSPKYINSPDSPWFRKGKLLFGLDQAREAWRAGKRAVLCEGYTDVMRLHAVGITEAVAPLGTAITAENAARVAAHADVVVLAFDADAAGERAALNAWALLVARGVEVRRLLLPEGQDPDDFVRAAGADAVQAALAAAPLFWPHLLASRVEAAPDLRARHEAVTAILERLAELADPVLADMLAGELAAAAAVSADAIRERLAKARRPGKSNATPMQTVEEAQAPNAIEAKLAAWVLRHPEDRLRLAGMLADLQLHPWLRLVLTGGHDASPAYQQWLGRVGHQEPIRADLDALVATVAEEARRRARRRELAALERERSALVQAGRSDEARSKIAAMQALIRQDRA